MFLCVRACEGACARNRGRETVGVCSHSNKSIRDCCLVYINNRMPQTRQHSNKSRRAAETASTTECLRAWQHSRASESSVLSLAEQESDKTAALQCLMHREAAEECVYRERGGSRS